MPAVKTSTIQELRKQLRSAKGETQAELYLKLAEAYSAAGPGNFDDAVAAAIKSAEHPSVAKEIAVRARIRSGSLSWTLGRMSDAETHYNAAATLASDLYQHVNREDQKQWELEQAAAWQGLAHVNVYRGNYESGRRYAEHALAVARRYNDLALARKSLVSLSIVYSNTSEYVKSLEVAQEAVQLAQEANDPGSEAFCRAALAHVYTGLGDVESAMAQQILAVDAADRSGVPGVISSACLTLGSSYLEKKDFNAAEEIFKKAEHANPKMKPRDRCVFLLNMGELSYYRGKHDRALELYQKGIEISIEIQNRRLTAIGRKDLGQVLAMTGQKKKGMKELLAALELARSLSELTIQCEIYEALVGLYEGFGKMREALDASKDLLKLKASVLLDEQQRKAMRIEAETKIATARKEKEIAEMRAAALEQEVARKQRELTKIALELAEKNEIIQSVRQEFAQLSAKNSEIKNVDSKPLRDTLDRFETSAAEQWSVFEAEFEKLNKVLYQKLSTLAPKLTPTELKVCALLRVGLGSKDIAKILFVSHLVVYNYRFKIREKLCLPEGVHLTTYLQGLLVG